MSTTVTYKGNTLTTIDNATKKLNTKGKYMEDDVTITDTSSASGGGDSGGPSYKLTTIVPEQTVTSTSPPQDDTDMLLLTSSDVLVEGDYYIVTVNDQKRAQTAVRNNYVLYLADITDAWWSGDRMVIMAEGNLYFCPWAAGSYTVKVEHLALKSSGGGGVIHENIVPQQTITATAGYNGLTSTAVLIEGADYEYTVNGETRLGTAVDVNGTLQLGDGDYYWLEEGGCIATDGSVMYFRTSAAGTYTVKVDKITLANSGLKTQVIFPEQSVTATTTEQSGYSANISVLENITDGANYIVTMDGIAYLCYGKQLYGNNDVYCGDDTVIWGNTANARYPFMVATWGNGTTAWGVADTTAHTVKIEKVLSFDSAELGKKTITANGTYTASTDDLDGYSSITVNVEGGSTRTIIVPEQTITASTAYTQLQFNAPLVDGEQYIVTINGETKALTAYTSNQSVFVIFVSSLYVDYTSPQMYLTIDNSSLYGTYTVKVEQESSGGGSANLQTKSVTYTPTTSQQTATVTADSGYDGLSEVNITVDAMPTGTAGTPTATKGTVSNHSISVTPSVTNTTGYITGGTQNGTAVTVSASELVSGTLSITSSGTKDVTNYASASVAAGTAGTPSATKGSVSNNSITVTPSVTNTTGYITGGTKTGTGVTVSASELVSGNLAITDNGTNINVTNYATVSVAVPLVTYYTGSSTPSSSLGSNGDIYLQS